MQFLVKIELRTQCLEGRDELHDLILVCISLPQLVVQWPQELYKLQLLYNCNDGKVLFHQYLTFLFIQRRYYTAVASFCFMTTVIYRHLLKFLISVYHLSTNTVHI